jgi:hypothetical protein
MDAPFARVRGRDGRHYLVWRNPGDQEAANLIAGSRNERVGLRGVLNERDLYIWQSVHVLHGDLARQTGIDGVRVKLAPNVVAVNEETVGVPSSFPWIFDNDGDLMEVNRRREIVERWLNANCRLAVICPRGSTVIWYM